MKSGILRIPLNKKNTLLSAALLLVLSTHSVFGDTFVVDFDTDDAGGTLVAGTTDLGSVSPYANLFGPGSGLALSTGNPVTNPLNLYNTEGTSGLDSDLERTDGALQTTWAGGTEVSTVFDNALIIQESGFSISTPNDDGGGGQMILDFDLPLVSFGFDFVDLDSSANATLTLTDTDGPTSTIIPFALFEDGAGPPYAIAGAAFGDRHANRVLSILASDAGLVKFHRVTFTMTSSGAIGTIYGNTQAPFPVELQSFSIE